LLPKAETETFTVLALDSKEQIKRGLTKCKLVSRSQLHFKIGHFEGYPNPLAFLVMALVKVVI